mgnify:CR=1 FL=1
MLFKRVIKVLLSIESSMDLLLKLATFAMEMDKGDNPPKVIDFKMKISR